MLYSRAGADSFTLFQVSKCKTLQGWLGFLVLFLFWVFFLRGDGGGGFGFLGFFCASVLTATLGNFATLIKKSGCGLQYVLRFFCLVGFWLRFF